MRNAVSRRRAPRQSTSKYYQIPYRHRESGFFHSRTNSKETSKSLRQLKILVALFVISVATNWIHWSDTVQISVERHFEREAQFYTPQEDRPVPPPVRTVELPVVALPTKRISRLFFHPFYGFLEIEDRGTARRQIRDMEPHISFPLTFDQCEGRYCKRRPLSCNQFHESGLLTQTPTYKFKYIGKGYYRKAFVVNFTVPGEDEVDSLVFKIFRDSEHELNKKSLEQVRKDAVVMEEMQSSPHIISGYGYCQLSVFVQALPLGDMKAKAAPMEKRRAQKLNDEKDVDPKNNYTAPQKLSMALDMATAVRDLHAASYVHDDLKLAQFLISNDGRIKLSDFSRTRRLEWDNTTNTFKTWRNGGRHGDCRSPEEYAEKQLSEKIDIFSLGSIFFSLLTGLIPFDEVTDEDEMMEKFEKGELPFVDPRYSSRSREEEVLVEAINRCWRYDPAERPSAQELVDQLRI